ncbi:alginate O-acetyltransferase AlgF [Pseudomonas syringae]|uniref:Alginate biosynthesis protein AlgF n=1 Tax=Pseudomonas syringae TaxID=317 RepID=A0A9Q4FIE3_PSESX|nr:alginate O-acetyltransferase AlgF [Pseudomonas syringae]MCF5470895.1 cell division protein FtsQ [Pseudomonas syringae]MCF5475727.1 cell division protein FtsQ [Pseudomonas syringae]MCF5485678.1 cell division protein FtsQ [Pseudomonas syringae]MCF5490177.1 cell division protein FtsQ [Pseudomonas syringae]MCF5494583.1 cell division protein FtsQ [Pseudomonas syringae]
MIAVRLMAGSVAALLIGFEAYAADIALYPTGPAQDSAFIRFINAAAAPLQVVAREGQTPLQLDMTKPVSLFFPVQASSPVKGTLISADKKLPLDISVEPGEFATVVVTAQADGSLKPVTVREQPDDFNGLKASLAFFSLDAGCSEASLRPAGRSGDLFKAVPTGTLQRRSINPVSLSVQLVCANAIVGAPLDLGELKAGERYSVLLVPSATGPRLLSATDSLSN